MIDIVTIVFSSSKSKVDPQFFHPASEGVGVDFQTARCSICPVNLTVCQHQRLEVICG
jgi:hypothetical protein